MFWSRRLSSSLDLKHIPLPPSLLPDESWTKEILFLFLLLPKTWRRGMKRRGRQWRRIAPENAEKRICHNSRRIPEPTSWQRPPRLIRDQAHTQNIRLRFSPSSRFHVQEKNLGDKGAFFCPSCAVGIFGAGQSSYEKRGFKRCLCISVQQSGDIYGRLKKIEEIKEWSRSRPLLLFSVLEFFGLFSTLSWRMMKKIVHSFSKESTNSLCTYFPYEGDEDDLSRAFSKISRSLQFAKKKRNSSRDSKKGGNCVPLYFVLLHTLSRSIKMFWKAERNFFRPFLDVFCPTRQREIVEYIQISRKRAIFLIATFTFA